MYTFPYILRNVFIKNLNLLKEKCAFKNEGPGQSKFMAQKSCLPWKPKLLENKITHASKYKI